MNGTSGVAAVETETSTSRGKFAGVSLLPCSTTASTSATSRAKNEMTTSPMPRAEPPLRQAVSRFPSMM